MSTFFFLSQPKLGRGGIFRAWVRPQEAITLRAIKAESKLRKQGISKYNKRFRAWAQQRVRKYNLATPVILTTDTKLMDGKYITACYQKAAKLRKHDRELWSQYSDRVLELSGSLSVTNGSNTSGNTALFSPSSSDLDAKDWGYILWSCGKSCYLPRIGIDKDFYELIRPALIKIIPQMESHALMSTLWCFKRIHKRDLEISHLVLRTMLEKLDEVRPLDFIKIVNCAAYLDVLPLERQSQSSSMSYQQQSDSTSNSFTSNISNPFRSFIKNLSGGFNGNNISTGEGSATGLAKRIAEVAQWKLDQAFAQEFRDAVNPVTLATIYARNPSLQIYILERFRRIFITARPHHLSKAYESAVTIRALFPQVYEQLSPECKQFYVRLSMRHIPAACGQNRSPSELHWNVSKHLAKLELDHRNAFRCGPYRVDVGQEMQLVKSIDESWLSKIESLKLFSNLLPFSSSLERLVEDDRRDCLMIDHPTSFYLGTNKYTRIRKLQHEVLYHLGWNVRRIRQDQWYEEMPHQWRQKERSTNAESESVPGSQDPQDSESKMNAKQSLLLKVLNAPPSPILLDPPTIAAAASNNYDSEFQSDYHPKIAYEIFVNRKKRYKKACLILQQARQQRKARKRMEMKMASENQDGNNGNLSSEATEYEKDQDMKSYMYGCQINHTPGTKKGTFEVEF